MPPPGGEVKIIVYDVRGTPIRTLGSDRYEPGTYTVPWNGRDEREQPVASGVYFVRMSAVAFEKTRKIVLLK